MNTKDLKILIRTVTGAIFEEFTRFVVLFCTALLVSIWLLYFGKSLWWAFIQTPLVRGYINISPAGYRAINEFYNRDLFRFAFDLNVLILKIGLIISIYSQISLVRLLFFEDKGLIGRLFFWSVPFSFIIAATIHRTYGMDWVFSFLISCVPASILLDYCMQLSSRILPDGLLFTSVYRAVSGVYCFMRRCDQP